MKNLIQTINFFILACALTGCLSSAPQLPSYWLLETVALTKPLTTEMAPTFESVRVAQVNVRAPYDGRNFVVLREGGEVAFDPCHSFAASPATLLRGLVWETVAASGRFKETILSTSHARAAYSLEVTVTRLALDCRAVNRRLATAEISVALLKGRELVKVVKGVGTKETADGAYGTAFSYAFSMALRAALDNL